MKKIHEPTDILFIFRAPCRAKSIAATRADHADRITATASAVAALRETSEAVVEGVDDVAEASAGLQECVKGMLGAAADGQLGSAAIKSCPTASSTAGCAPYPSSDVVGGTVSGHGQAAGSVRIIQCAAPKSITTAGAGPKGAFAFRRTVVCHTNKKWSDDAKTRCAEVKTTTATTTTAPKGKAWDFDFTVAPNSVKGLTNWEGFKMLEYNSNTRAFQVTYTRNKRVFQLTNTRNQRAAACN